MDSTLVEGDNRYCEYCKFPYNWRKSTSKYLKMTFCCFTHERFANGCLIEDILDTQRTGYPLQEIAGRYETEIRELLPV